MEQWSAGGMTSHIDKMAAANREYGITVFVKFGAKFQSDLAVRRCVQIQPTWPDFGIIAYQSRLVLSYSTVVDSKALDVNIGLKENDYWMYGIRCYLGWGG